MIPFAEDLNGVTAAEVGALLTFARKPEHRVYSTSNGSKTVRRYKAAPLGIEINVTEVFFGHSCSDEFTSLTGLGGSAIYGESTFTVETVEWEFKVATLSKLNAEIGHEDDTVEAARIGNRDLFLWLRDFEGCRDTYKHEMSMIRLAIGLFAET